MKENLDYLFAFDTFFKAWNNDQVSTEIFLKAKDSASLKISNLVVNRPMQFGDKEYSSLSVNDLMEVLADNKDFKNYCDAIVQDTRGRILIVQRTNGDEFQPSTWALPGGKAEQGEFLRDAVKRELVEETNLKSSHCNYSTLYKNQDGSFSHYFWCYVENCDDIILEADELQRYAWIDLNELDKYDFMLDLKDRIKSIFNIPFKGKYLTEQELTALAQVDIKKAYTAASLETSYQKGCLMLDTNWVSREGNNRWDEILCMINPDDLYAEEGFGKEYNPHITVLYGFDLDKVAPEHIERLLPEGAISFRICDVSYFESELYDVLKFGIESEQLHELNATYRSLPHQNSYPDYRPHLTIAYLKKGRAERYISALKNWVNYAFQSSKFDYSYNDENGKKAKAHWDVKGFSSIGDDPRDNILKARKTYQIGDISQSTGLKKVAPGKWVDPKTGKEVKADENGSPRAGKVKPADISSHTDEDLSEYAKNSSESDLQAVIKESNEPRLREAAHKELERRSKEEKPQTEESKKEEKKDEPKESKKAEIHPEIKEKSKEIVEKLESFKGDEDLNQEDLNEVIDLLKSGDIENAFKKMKDSEISYSLPTSYENLKKLSIDFEIDKKFGLDFATKPGKYDVFRAGDVSDQKNGIFFSITEGGASAYSDGGKRPVKKYTIDIKNPLVSKRAEDAYSLLSGKPKQEILKERDRAKSIQKWWVDLDTKVAALAKKKGYDAITYTSPAPPAIREVISLDKKNVEEKDKKE